MSLAERIALVNEKIAAAARQAGREPSEVTLVAATKVQTSDTIRQAIAAGVTICGENRVQEMTAHLDDDAYAGAALHFIGHLPHLVGLKVANEVPAHVGGQSGYFCQQLLYAAFAEKALSGGICLLQCFYGVKFAYSDKLHTFGECGAYV